MESKFVGDRLQRIFDYQKAFMNRLGVRQLSEQPTYLEMHELSEDTLPIAYALLDEVHEVMDELHWKPWKRQNPPVNIELVHQELIDCWFFLLELSIMWRLDAKMLLEKYEEKLKVNNDRQDKGY